MGHGCKAFVAAAGLLLAATACATQTSTIDFEDLDNGSYYRNLSSGGARISPFCHVDIYVQAHIQGSTGNAMGFDPSGCSPESIYGESNPGYLGPTKEMSNVYMDFFERPFALLSLDLFNPFFPSGGTIASSKGGLVDIAWTCSDFNGEFLQCQWVTMDFGGPEWTGIKWIEIRSYGGPGEPNIFFDNLIFRVVPEPGTLALLGFGLMAIALTRRTRASISLPRRRQSRDRGVLAMGTRLCVVAAVALSHTGTAFALPIEAPSALPGGAKITGIVGVDAVKKSLEYDVSTGLLRYADSSYTVGMRGWPLWKEWYETQYVDMSFEWEVTVNEAGVIKGPGSARLYLDFGDGMELLASGQVRDIGSVLYDGYFNCDLETNWCYWGAPQISVKIDYQSPKFYGLTGESIGDWLRWSGYFVIGQQTPSAATSSFFSQSFYCDSGGPLNPDTSFNRAFCSSFTGDDFFFYRVPSPGGFGLLGLGLACLGLTRRRRAH